MHTKPNKNASSDHSFMFEDWLSVSSSLNTFPINALGPDRLWGWT